MAENSTPYIPRELTPKAYKYYKEKTEKLYQRLQDSIIHYHAPRTQVLLDYQDVDFPWQHSSKCESIEYFPGTLATGGCYILCAYVLLQFFGGKKSLEEITAIANNGDWHHKILTVNGYVGAGTWRWFFDSILPHYGVQTKYHASFNAIPEALRNYQPLVALVNKSFWEEMGQKRTSNHCVVIIGADRDSMIVYDSTMGIVHYKACDFMKHVMNLESVF